MPSTLSPTVAHRSQPLRFLAETAGFACVVAFGYSLASAPGEPAIWWPPIGAVIAWLLSRPRRDWPAVVVLASLVRIAFGVSNGVAPSVAIWVVASSVTGGLLSAHLLRRYHGRRAPLSEPYDIVAFAVVAILVTGPLAALSASAYRVVMTSGTLTWLSPLHWSLGESVGAFLVAPLMLTLGDAREWWRTNGAARRLELLTVLAVAGSAAAVVMLAPLSVAEARRPLLAFVAVPSMWAALRIGMFAVSWVQLIAGSIAAWGLLNGLGVISALPTTNGHKVLLVQAYLLTLAVSVMIVAATFASQKRSVARALVSEARFRRLVEAAPVAMLVEGGVDEPPYYNPRFATLLGAVGASRSLEGWWGDRGLTPRQHAELDATVDADPAAEIETARAPMAGEPRPPVTADLTSTDGTARHVEIHRSAVGDHRITAVVDLTDRARLEEQLRQANKLEALGTLASGVAHDFNNMLGAIIGNLDLARRTIDTGHEASACLADAELASRRAADLVRQILAFSRQPEAERQVLSVRDLFGEVAATLRADAPAGVAVKVAEGRDIPHVLGEAAQLRQALQNLGTNALQAMAERGGTLTLALESVDVTADIARRHPELRVERYARFTVGDTGIGMRKEVLDRAFEPFFTTRRPGEGSGLGLAVVHGVVSAHQGAVVARSAPNEGSWFGVYLPATAAVPVAPAAPVGATRTLDGLRVLAVDDEAVLARFVSRALTHLGGVPTVVTTPHEVLAILRAHPGEFDLVLTDLTMPDMSGLALADEVRLLEPGLPVLLMSGDSSALASEERGHDAIAGVLQKPFAPDALARAVLAAARTGATIARA